MTEKYEPHKLPLCGFLLCVCALFFAGQSNAQFAPAAGKAGSTAIRHDSSCFVGWATKGELQQGLRNIAWPDSGNATAGNIASAFGEAMSDGVVSLGDGGMVTLGFQHAIQNGPGWDFAVFENSFLDSFLEFAFVEVSTDGSRFVRFPSQSLTDTSVQVAAFGYTKPENIYNLAGKYRVGFGTPFDLEELIDSAGIDIQNIQFVRIIDVVGSINNAYGSRDNKGRKINDPWPTPFPSSGFDLDAVGVIHHSAILSKYNPKMRELFELYPNPGIGNNIQILSTVKTDVALFSSSGKHLGLFHVVPGTCALPVNLKPGVYFMQIGFGHQTIRFIVQ